MPSSVPPAEPRRRPNVWRLAIWAGVIAVGGLAYADWRRAAPPDALAQATYVGRQVCFDCHAEEHEDWVGSHHDLAMDLATDQSVLADFSDETHERLGITTRFFRDGESFMVNTVGPDGKYADFEIKYTFGVDPLQQYMVEFPDGRVQVLRVSWDTHRKKWFYVPPPDVVDERIEHNDPLHWTGIAQNWNTTCADCHSTNLQKNYELETDTYHTTFSEIDVSCEACHGPASFHVELANRRSLFWDHQHGYGLAKLKGLDSTAEIEACAQCHSRRDAVHPNFRPGTPLLDSYEPSLLLTGLYHADGQILDEVYVYGSFVQSKMHQKGVRCTDCHNPHSLKLKFEGNRLCAQCHEPAKYDTSAHHHHSATGAGAQCVACHMPETTYMVIDPRRDHSLRIPRPDLTVSLDTPNACNSCHTKHGEDATWAAKKVVQWYGKKHPDDPHWAPAIAAGHSGASHGAKLLREVLRCDNTPSIVKATALQLLSRYPGQQTERDFAKSLDDFDPFVRLAAVRSIRGDDASALVNKLSEKLSDPIRVVRTEAARRLAGTPQQVMTNEQRKAFHSSLAEYHQRQSLQADHASAHMNLAELALQMQSPEKAIDELRIAIEREPYLNGPRGLLASLLESSGADEALVRSLREQEIKLLQRDQGYFPDQHNLRYRLGLLHYELNQLAEAEIALRETCDLAPENYDYLMALALLQERRFTESGDELYFQHAVDSLKKLEQLAPADPRVKNILKRMLARHGRLKQQAEP